MYRSIVAPLDGSEFAEQALPEALAIARASGGWLRLVRVREPAPAFLFATALAEPEAAGSAVAACDSDEGAYLGEVAERVRREAAREVAVEVLDGPVVAALCDNALEPAAGLIVLATHGRGRIRRMWLGSVAEGVTLHAGVPVLLIRAPDEAAPRTPGRLFRQILLPLDGSPDAATILPHAIALASFAGAAYTLLHVLPPASLTGYALPEESLRMDWSEMEERGAEALLEREAAAMRLQSLRVRERVVRTGNTAGAILATAAEAGADLIAMAAHGHGLGNLILGDVADEVVRRSPVPVLHYHAPDR